MMFYFPTSRRIRLSSRVLPGAWRRLVSVASWVPGIVPGKDHGHDHALVAASWRLWEGRFKSQALLDDAAVLACMVYVDLNPIRAGMAETPEESDFTAIQERLRQVAESQQFATPESPDPVIQQPADLLPFTGDEPLDIATGIAFALPHYLQRVDWTGSAVRDDKRGAIPSEIQPIVQRMGLNHAANVWAGTGSRGLVRVGRYIAMIVVEGAIDGCPITRPLPALIGAGNHPHAAGLAPLGAFRPAPAGSRRPSPPPPSRDPRDQQSLSGDTCAIVKHGGIGFPSWLSSQPIRIGSWIDFATSSVPERVLGTAGQTGRVDQTMIKALCGIDSYTGQDYEHRREWLVTKMKSLSGIFSIDICAYAVMSNHYHVILHVDTATAATWPQTEVIDR